MAIVVVSCETCLNIFQGCGNKIVVIVKKTLAFLGTVVNYIWGNVGHLWELLYVVVSHFGNIFEIF